MPFFVLFEDIETIFIIIYLFINLIHSWFCFLKKTLEAFSLSRCHFFATMLEAKVN